MRPLKVCIVGLKCFDQIAENSLPRYLGGIETQLVVLARGLVRQGCEVSLITYDHGQEEPTRFDGVTVIKSYDPEKGLPLLRGLYPRSTALWRAMRQADSDVYLQMGAGLETGQVATGCRLLPGGRRPFVFCLASDANFGEHLRAGRFGWEGRVYRYGLGRADRVVAQTEQQRARLRSSVGFESEVVPMAVAPPAKSGPRSMSGRSHPRVLWIGRTTPGKRFEWLLEAARRCPDLRFDVAGTPNRHSSYAIRLLEEASQISNLKAHGRVSAAQLAALYEEGTILCCTSELEGFPTTFLEAWSCGLPVVTTFDPDQVVSRHGLGRVAENLDQVIFHLQDLVGDADSYRGISRAAVDYIAQNHSPERVARRFRTLLEEVAGIR